MKILVREEINNMSLPNVLHFLHREDEEYGTCIDQYRAKSTAAKIIFLLMHLLPGFVAYLLLYYEHDNIVRLTGLSSENAQYLCLIVITFSWYIILPIALLRLLDKLTFRGCIRFLSLDKVDWQGLLVLLIILIPFTILSIPYMRYVYLPLRAFLETIPAFQTPEYSIFQENKIHAFAPFQLALLFVGNFLGEELYFRGYLLKKIGFLGNYAWFANSVLFTFYHIWQAPLAWPSVGLFLIFGLMMQLRKNLYVLIVLHIFLNIVWFSWVLALVRG
jgi:hypothetical protein